MRNKYVLNENNIYLFAFIKIFNFYKVEHTDSNDTKLYSSMENICCNNCKQHFKQIRQHSIFLNDLNRSSN